jgi:transposase-like protein
MPLAQPKKNNSIISISLTPTLVNIPIAQINNPRELVRIYLQTVADWTGVCNCKGLFIKHGGYRRKTPLAGAIFWIQRVICPSCGKTHALIPCFVFPYSRVMAHIKEAAIRGICYETHTMEQLAELCGVEPATVMRWWKSFRAAGGSLLNWLAGELARRVEPATWLGGGFESPRAMGRKIFSLFGLYRSTYYPKFIHSDFNLLCLVNPLVFLRN